MPTHEQTCCDATELRLARLIREFSGFASGFTPQTRSAAREANPGPRQCAHIPVNPPWHRGEQPARRSRRSLSVAQSTSRDTEPGQGQISPASEALPILSRIQARLKARSVQDL